MEVLHNNSSSLVVVRTNCFFSFQLFCFWLYSLTFQDAKHSFLLLLFWFQSSAQRSRPSSPHSVPLCCKLWRRGKLNFEVYRYVIFKSVLFFFYTCLKINKRQNINNFYSFNLLNTALIQLFCSGVFLKVCIWRGGLWDFYHSFRLGQTQVKFGTSFATSQICQEEDVSHTLINVPPSTSEFVIYFNSQASNIQRRT